MKSEKLTPAIFKKVVEGIHDHCLKTKKVSLLDTMIAINKEIGVTEELIGEILYYEFLECLDDIIESNKGDDE